MSLPLTLTDLEVRLLESLTAQAQEPWDGGRELIQSAASLQPASVLILLGFVSSSEPAAQGPFVLYLMRTQTVEAHKGQVAFPGGCVEPGEEGHPEVTALREAQEEVGLAPEQIQVVGRLPALATVTGFLIQPIVGLLRHPFDPALFDLDPAEVDFVFWVSLQELMAPGVYRKEWIQAESGGTRHSIDTYSVRLTRRGVESQPVGRAVKIWGATGAMTRRLIQCCVGVGVDFEGDVS